MTYFQKIYIYTTLHLKCHLSSILIAAVKTQSHIHAINFVLKIKNNEKKINVKNKNPNAKNPIEN